MGRIFIILAVLPAFLFTLSGCASTSQSKESDLQAQGLRNQITLLESQVRSKDDEINGLRDALARQSPESTSASLASMGGKVDKAGMAASIKKPNLKQIQLALKNAGYEPGSLDGKMGKQTKQAVKAFQKANNLFPDGRVGKKTWRALSKYLDKQA